MDIEIDEKDLPFRAEYAKSGRSSCKACKTSIDQGSLRLARMVQSHRFDGRQPNWFHKHCFFNKQKPESEGDIANFSNIRTSDQKEIREQISKNSGGDVVLPSAKGGKKRSKKSEPSNNAAVKDFGVEYAKSGRANCVGCHQNIAKNAVRVKKVVYDTEVGAKFGGQPLWHHIECFAEVRNDVGWFETGEQLPGFSSLTKDDQKMVKKILPAMKLDEIPAKKMKLEPKDEVDAIKDKELEQKYDKQQGVFMKYRDLATKDMERKDVIEVLEFNNQIALRENSDTLYNQFADCLAFGALKGCETCSNGQFVFNRTGYLCQGDLTEWTKCSNFIKEPEKNVCKIPGHIKKKYSALKKYKSKVEIRIIKYIPPSSSTLAKMVKKEENDEGPRVKRERPAFYNLTFAIVGLKTEEADLKKEIEKLGGKVSSKIDNKTIAIISTEDEVKKMSAKIRRAQEQGIHVVPTDFIEAAKADPSGTITYITSKTLCDWGTDPSVRVPVEDNKSMKSKSIYTKSVPKSVTLKLKGGLAVDPDSHMADIAHVYKDNKGNIFNAVLGITDIQKNKNSYYKLQILEDDRKNEFWLFRSWGRIGTTIGDKKLQSYDTVNDAIKEFKFQYSEKTGNDFDDRKNFEKVSGRYYPIDVEYSEDDKVKELNIEHKIISELHLSVQNLIKLLFDVDTMKRVMLEFDLDMEKMPLGKLSQKQIQSAYKVLNELNLLIQNGNTNKSKFIDATNRFFTLIPHSFGIDTPPVLDTLEQIKTKCEMLDNLMEIECAYNMMKNEGEEDASDEKNPIDQHYEQLKTELIPIDRKSEEFVLLEKYVQNTHADTHRMYELEIVDIFKVTRQNEARRYKPFKKLHNKKLLWHGSRLTNFAGILSHGLKIAPPEAPATGYMFGKGIYFADMVSKSANYCFTSKLNSTGILLLSEVALGNMFECHNANYVTKLPKDKHSTKGIGRTQPNPKESHMRDDVEIPLGKGVTDTNITSSLLYNEFIVYDVAQVNIQYLFKMNFNYKY